MQATDGAAATVGPMGAVVNGPAGAQVNVPAGALGQGEPVAIAQVSTGFSPLPAGMRSRSEVFAFLPHGLRFATPVAVTVPFSGSGSGVALYTSSPGGPWTAVPDARIVGNTLGAEVMRFSFFVALENLRADAAVVDGPAPDGGAAEGRTADSRLADVPPSSDASSQMPVDKAEAAAVDGTVGSPDAAADLTEDAPADVVANCGRIKCDCTFNGKRLWGKIQYVTSFPDVKVRETTFPDLRVQEVTAFPDRCGKWQIVTAFPDLKVQKVTAFEDFQIQHSSFPGIP